MERIARKQDVKGHGRGRRRFVGTAVSWAWSRRAREARWHGRGGPGKAPRCGYHVVGAADEGTEGCRGRVVGAGAASWARPCHGCIRGRTGRHAMAVLPKPVKQILVGGHESTAEEGSLSLAFVCFLSLYRPLPLTISSHASVHASSAQEVQRTLLRRAWPVVTDRWMGKRRL